MAVIAEIWRFPFKSMAGERLRAVEVSSAGLHDDRRYAFVDSKPSRAGKLLTARQSAELLRFHATAERGEVRVTTPAGSVLSAQAPELAREAAALVGRELTVSEAPGQNFDESPVLLMNLAGIRQVEAELGLTLDRRRFRANLYLEGMEPGEELNWVGRRLSAGGCVLEGMWLCERCVVPTIDPDSLQRRPELLRHLFETRDGNLGLRCRVIHPGPVREGDPCRPL